MTYEEINGTLAGNDLTYLLVYANQVTHNLFGLAMTISFFLVVFIGSAMMQLRFSQRIKPETSYLASCFATLGFATILEQTSGILSPVYFFLLIGMTIIGVIWVSLSSD